MPTQVKDAATSEDRLTTLKMQLPQIVFPAKFQLPLSPDMVASGLNVGGCRVMSSKKLPLWLSVKPADIGADNMMVLFKAGDDLRQDQLTLQVLQIMDRLWKAEGLDLCMSPYVAPSDTTLHTQPHPNGHSLPIVFVVVHRRYRCVSTGNELGMLEIVTNSDTLAGITSDAVNKKSKAGKIVKRKGLAAKLRAAMNVYLQPSVLSDWLKSQPGYDEKVVSENFARSCAGYCVATYVLGIGDRHNDNIMMTKVRCLRGRSLWPWRLHSFVPCCTGWEALPHRLWSLPG